MVECIVDSLKRKGFLCAPDMKEIHLSTIDPFVDYIISTYTPKPFVLSKKMYDDFILLQQKKNKETELKAVLNFRATNEITTKEVIHSVNCAVSTTQTIVAAVTSSIQMPKVIETESADETTEEEYEEGMNEVILPSKKRIHIDTSVKIKRSHDIANKKLVISDWVTYYTDRYNKIRDILARREELKNAISISRISKSDGRQKVEIIAIVHEIRKLHTGACILNVEDPTGTTKVFIKNDQQKIIEQLVNDEVIGIIGSYSKEYIYIDKIIFPDIPNNPIKKADQEVYAAFISDIHVGSNMFLDKEFSQCIEWLSGRMGSQGQRAMAERIKYLFIVGDLVDGVGIYPGQEKELKINDIYDQYNEVGKYLSKLPDDIHIIAIPGNHDAVRLSEPQPPFYKDFSSALYNIPNLTVMSNPSIATIHNVDKFPGFNVLSYHGQSFDHYIANVPYLIPHGYDRADLVQEMFLRKRHLSPSHGATSQFPSPVDTLVIDHVPDIFATGHIHKTKVGKYKNVINLNCGCFQDKTSFQEKLGHNPEPGRVPIVNLQSGEVKLMRFR